MSSSLLFRLLVLIGCIASQLVGGNDVVIGPCINDACPLQYECKNDFCTFVNNEHADDYTTVKMITTDVTPTGIPASTAAIIELSTASSMDNTDSTLSDIPADDALPSSFTQTFTSGVSSFVSSTTTSSQESSTSTSTTTITAETTTPTAASDFPTSFDSNFIPSSEAPLSLSTISSSSTTTTKSLFDFGSPCFFGTCSTGYECKNFWCIRTSSSTTLFPTTTATTQISSRTEEPSEIITGPCIGNSCPDDGSVCKNGFCVKSHTPGTCMDKRFGCALISYLCNIFTDIMTEDCAYTCKKC